MSESVGIQMIAKERQEQIEKHGYSIMHDVDTNQEYELVEAAIAILDDNIEEWPDNWDKNLFNKIASKEYKDKLAVAGALLAAEIDKANATDIQTLKEQQHDYLDEEQTSSI